VLSVKDITMNKVWVVCNANGECLGVFTTYNLADQVSEGQGAYISEHSIIADIKEYSGDLFPNRIMDNND